MRFILCCFWVFSLAAKPLEIAVNASSAILMNADTGAILYEKEAHARRYPASITKIATALFVLEAKKPPLDQLTTVSAEALKIKPVKQPGEYPAYWGEIDGTRMGLIKGEILSMESLLHGLLLVSGNDAANAIAETCADSIPDFVQEMNQYILSLGCQNTQFQNPHGLHHPEHVTTAFDMGLIAKRALQIPKLREIVSKPSYSKPSTNRSKATELRQSNPLLKVGHEYYYPKAIGMKTGYHSRAMHTIVAAATHEGRTLIAVLLGCPKRADRYEGAIRLFKAAFAEKKETSPLFDPKQTFTLNIPGAKLPLQASLKTALALSFYPAEEPTCQALIHWSPPPFPIHKGQKVGEIHILDEHGSLLGKGDLLAKEEVTGTLFFMLKEHLGRLFQ